jgi:hypothetical protein
VPTTWPTWPPTPSSHRLGLAAGRLDPVEKEERNSIVYMLANQTAQANGEVSEPRVGVDDSSTNRLGSVVVACPSRIRDVPDSIPDPAYLFSFYTA